MLGTVFDYVIAALTAAALMRMARRNRQQGWRSEETRNGFGLGEILEPERPPILLPHLEDLCRLRSSLLEGETTTLPRNEVSPASAAVTQASTA